jgi:hypothetical protein
VWFAGPDTDIDIARQTSCERCFIFKCQQSAVHVTDQDRSRPQNSSLRGWGQSCNLRDVILTDHSSAYSRSAYACTIQQTQIDPNHQCHMIGAMYRLSSCLIKLKPTWTAALGTRSLANRVNEVGCNPGGSTCCCYSHQHPRSKQFQTPATPKNQTSAVVKSIAFS